MSEQDAKQGSALDTLARRINAHQAQTLFWVCVILVVLGLGIFIRGPVMFAVQGWRAQSWEEAQASVASVDRGAQQMGQQQQQRKRQRETVRINYIYEWKGVSYEGNRLSLSRGSASSTWRDELIAKLEEAKNAGTPITIYVNPTTPWQSVVDRTLRWSELGYLGYLGLLVAALSGVGVAVAWRAKKLHAA